MYSVMNNFTRVPSLKVCFKEPDLCRKFLERTVDFSGLYNQRLNSLLRCSCDTGTSESTVEHKSQMLSCETPYLKYLRLCPKVLTLLLSLKDIFIMMHSAFDRQLPVMLVVVWLSSYALKMCLVLFCRRDTFS